MTTDASRTLNKSGFPRGSAASPFFESAGCPFCGIERGSCHVCHGSGRIAMWTALCEAVANVWARPGCACDACRRLGKGWSTSA